MPEMSTPDNRLSRREFLKAGVGGGVALCLAGVFGCAQEGGVSGTKSPQTAEKGFVRLTPSRWFSRLDGARVRCELCPKRAN